VLPVEDVQHSASNRLQGLRVLAVEDNDVNQLVLNEILAVQEGATVTLASDGLEALKLLEQRGYSSFDVVITDIQMPNMNGYQLSEHISSQKPGFPVIALTANSMSDERDRCLAAGMINYLSKPIDIMHLVNILSPFIRVENLDSQPDPLINQQRREAEYPAFAKMIDWQALNERFDHRQVFIDRLIDTALKSNRDLSQKLTTAQQARDYQAIISIAHTLKGLGGNLKAATLYRQAVLTETAAKNHDASAIGLAAQLSRMLQTLMNELVARQVEVRKNAE
jgi:CheY-like chemotaxis protein